MEVPTCWDCTPLINAAATSPKTADAGMNMAMILVVVIAATGAVVYARRRMNYTK